MTAREKLKDLLSPVLRSAGVFVRDVGAGLLEVSHNSLALLGLCVVAAAIFAGGRADLRATVEQHALDWLLARQEARDPSPAMIALAEPDAVSRATAVDLSALPRQQAAVVQWLSRRYRVAPEPVGRLVQEAWQVGQRMGIEPTLILAVMAIESSFNPFAQSPVGAQGLMQVMTRVHDDKYEAFGGTHAAFDPVTNLRVGVQVLKECIARAGGLEAGLRTYVGAANLTDDGGYVGKVLAEQLHLRKVADGKQVAFNAPLPSVSPPVAAQPSDAAPSSPGGEQVAMLR
ncbi:MAG: lytic transglycosylase domain-containing protein [Burkholderiales bacterium]|nr:lytic transglycosylase domain-containing protein [Burkholderiales bacterium]